MLMKKRISAITLIFLCIVTGILMFRLQYDKKKQQTNETPEKETLTFLTFKRETRHIFEKIINDFNESQEDIYVEQISVPDPDQGLKIRAVQGNFPDIIEFIGAKNDVLEEYIQGGYLQPLTNCPITRLINEHFLEKLKTHNDLYIIPLSVNYRGIFYNKKLMEEEGYTIPSTYDELIDTMEQIKKSGELPIIFPDKDSWTIHQSWDAIDMSSRGSQDSLFQIASKGITPLNLDSIAIDSTVKFGEIRKYGQENTLNTGYDEAVKTFATEEVYMFLQGNWAYPMIKKINPEIELLFMPFPTDTGNDPEIVAKIDASLGISASCNNPNAAQRFLDYVFSKPISSYYANMAGSYSCIKSVNSEDDYAQAFSDHLNEGTFSLEEKNYWEEKSDERDILFQKLVSQSENYTPETFLEELNDLLTSYGGDSP